MLAGELNSGGCNTNFQVPTRGGGSQHFLLLPSLPSGNPGLYLGLIAVLVIAGLVLGLFLIYVSSVFRFILFDSVLAKYCEIRRYWVRRQGPGASQISFELTGPHIEYAIGINAQRDMAVVRARLVSIQAATR